MVGGDKGPGSVRSAFFAGCLSALFLAPAAAEESSRSGHGHVSVSYQYIHVDGFEASQGTLDIGTVDTHVLNFELDYALTDRWSFAFGIPFIRERYQGNFPHDPLLLDPPRPQVENVDLGQWNQDFQDFHLGVRYLAKASGRLRIEPYITAGLPSNDYPFFGHAAIGQNLWRVEPGSSFVFVPYISDAWYRLDIGYAFVEETLGVSINHWNIRAEVGYFFNQYLSGRAFLLHKQGDGLVFPEDFPIPRNTELWYQHDRMIKHNFTNFGVGLDWSMNDNYSITTSALTMVRAEQVHKVDYAFTVGLAFAF
jgi:hypothetical protein